MYPLRLNLLTEDKKDRLVKTAQFKFVQTISLTILFTISITAIALLLSENLLQKYFTSIAQNTLVVSNKYASASKEIADINKLTKKVEEIQKQYNPLSPIIVSLSSSTPSGITFTSLDVNYKEKTIKISGIADTRQNFLNFQEELKNNPDLSNLESPVSDLTKKENISFNLIAKIK